jgi:hypothetical protein
MFDRLIRNYEKGVRRLFKSRGGVIENENQPPPIPGVVKLPGTLDLIAAIFDADAKRLEAEHNARVTQRFESTASLGSIPNAGSERLLAHHLLASPSVQVIAIPTAPDSAIT